MRKDRRAANFSCCSERDTPAVKVPAVKVRLPVTAVQWATSPHQKPKCSPPLPHPTAAGPSPLPASVSRCSLPGRTPLPLLDTPSATPLLPSSLWWRRRPWYPHPCVLEGDTQSCPQEGDKSHARPEVLVRRCFIGGSLVAQWLRVCLPMQRTRVRALVWEDPTCCGATGPVSHNC